MRTHLSQALPTPPLLLNFHLVADDGETSGVQRLAPLHPDLPLAYDVTAGLGRGHGQAEGVLDDDWLAGGPRARTKLVVRLNLRIF